MFVPLLVLAFSSAVVFAQQGITIEGRVLTTSGAPVRRAIVQVRRLAGGDASAAGNRSEGGAAPVAAVESDGDGRFSMPGIQPGPVTVEASLSGYLRTSEPVSIPAGQNS